MKRALVGATRLLLTATVGVLLLYSGLRGIAMGAASEPSTLPSSAAEEITPVGPVAPVMLTQIQAVHGPAIVVTASVGLNPAECATSTAVTVTLGVEVVFCYLVTNTGDVTFTDHYLVDPALGLDSSLPDVILSPAGGVQSAFFLTVAKELTTSALHTVTWTATNATGDVAVAQDWTRVSIPAIRLTYTVGLDPHTCALSDTVIVMAGHAVTHCYQVENIGDLTFYHHQLENSLLVTTTLDWPATLEPGATLLVTATAIATTTATNVLTWTAYVSDDLYAVAVDEASVRIPAIETRTTVGDNPEECADTEAITVTIGVSVTYCYYVYNVGGTPLTRMLVDDLVLDDETIVVTEALSEDSALWFKVTAPITQATVNTVTWTALTAEGLVVSDVATAYVHALSVLSATAFYDVDRDGEQSPMEYGIPT